MTNETNSYASNHLRRHRDSISPDSHFLKWPENRICVRDMRCFIAITVAMGIVKEEVLEDSRSTDLVTVMPFFGQVMRRDLWLNILLFFHLANNANYVLNGQPGYEPEFKLGAPYVRMIECFAAVFKPSQYISIDEGTIAFRGKVRFKVFNPMKPGKYRIKAYKLCNLSNGYCARYELYTATPHGESNGPAKRLHHLQDLVRWKAKKTALKGQMHHHDDLGSKCAYMCHLSNKTTRKSVLLSTPQIWLMKVSKNPSLSLGIEAAIIRSGAYEVTASPASDWLRDISGSH